MVQRIHFGTPLRKGQRRLERHKAALAQLQSRSDQFGPNDAPTKLSRRMLLSRNNGARTSRCHWLVRRSIPVSSKDIKKRGWHPPVVLQTHHGSLAHARKKNFIDVVRAIRTSLSITLSAGICAEQSWRHSNRFHRGSLQYELPRSP